MDTHACTSVVQFRLCHSAVNGDACGDSRNRLGQWARHYATNIVFCILLSNWFFPAWDLRLGAGNWRPKPGIPDRRPGGMANAVRDRRIRVIGNLKAQQKTTNTCPSVN